MLDSKPCDTPVVKGARLSIHNGVKLANAAEYRAIIGALQYLTITRSDICFGVNYVSQFMYSPTDLHFQLAFIGSDWDGCPDTRRSTSGLLTQLVDVTYNASSSSSVQITSEEESKTTSSAQTTSEED
ncbi:uncharacterized protein LOC113345232 [Papaver somniferum]|uniref:uncharacterized protein LOC113345232 n=1 Tax=Papaver somniferum TaxID=3469 RepID=UPI000E7029BA|nr:uncharacterized protein LOC113345232 [Papaver somniferum]